MSLEPRPYQQRIVGKTLQAYDRGLISTLIESPTGSGKTVMALSIAREMEKRGMRIGYVAHRRNLLKQASEENQEFFGIKNIEFISLFQNQLPDGINFLILDECHHQACNTCVSLLNRVKPKSFLGMTATPFRTDRMQLSFQKVIKDAGIHILIQQGFLAPYQHFVIPDFNPVSIAETYIRERARWGKSVIFFLTTEDCYECKRLLGLAGIRAEVVTHETDRDLQLSMFEKGDVDVLINVFILTEGFDCPPLKTVFVRPSGRGPSIQMGGRVFRRHETKPWANIVQCRNTHFSFPQRVRAQAEWIWAENQWRSVAGNENVVAVQAKTLKIIAESNVTLPELVRQALNTSRGARRLRRSRSSFNDLVQGGEY